MDVDAAKRRDREHLVGKDAAICSDAEHVCPRIAKGIEHVCIDAVRLENGKAQLKGGHLDGRRFEFLAA